MNKYISFFLVLGLVISVGSSVVRAEEVAVEADASVDASVTVKPTPGVRVEAMKAKADARADALKEIGRASCRERV